MAYEDKRDLRTSKDGKLVVANFKLMYRHTNVGSRRQGRHLTNVPPETSQRSEGFDAVKVYGIYPSGL